MKRIRFGLFLFVVAITLQLAWYAVLMVSYVRTPGKLEGADFLFYYSVGRVARHHGLGAVYNLDLESAAQAEVTGLPVGAQQIFLSNHPPVFTSGRTVLLRPGLPSGVPVLRVISLFVGRGEPALAGFCPETKRLVANPGFCDTGGRVAVRAAVYKRSERTGFCSCGSPHG